jgi:hypothetical protein
LGLLVLDLTGSKKALSYAAQGRLLSLAREHHSRVLILSDTPPSAGSLGPLISLRVEPQRLHMGPGQFAIAYHIRKNKQGLPLRLASESRRAPWGVR